MDNLEIGLRRLSAHVYELRTGNSSGAMHMLAVRAPGAGVDAPSWLVADVTTFSKAEHQRSERVQGRRGGGYRARGRGDGGGKGRGKGDSSAGADAGGKGDAGGRGGRGGKGRRGGRN
eukprot:2922351-Heterocapsa_arctica.AAC.1